MVMLYLDKVNVVNFLLLFLQINVTIRTEKRADIYFIWWNEKKKEKKL